MTFCGTCTGPVYHKLFTRLIFTSFVPFSPWFQSLVLLRGFGYSSAIVFVGLAILTPLAPYHNVVAVFLECQFQLKYPVSVSGYPRRILGPQLSIDQALRGVDSGQGVPATVGELMGAMGIPVQAANEFRVMILDLLGGFATFQIPNPKQGFILK